eukprot:g1908.t1
MYGNEKYHSNLIDSLNACQAEERKSTRVLPVKIISVPQSFRIPRKGQAFQTRKKRASSKSSGIPAKDFGLQHPKGLLQYGWCWKWIAKIPATVIYVADFTSGKWRDAKNEDTEKSFLSTIDEVRKCIQTEDRNTFVLTVAVVQDDCDTAEMNDLVYTLKCGIAKSIFVIKSSALARSPTVSSDIAKIMKALYHHNSNCYARQIRKYRRYGSRIKHESQIGLSVRHSFKMGFFNEMCGHDQQAVTAYRLAYAKATTLNVSHVHLFAVKSMCGLINHRMLSILVNTGQIHAAIVQFNRFANMFRDRFECAGGSVRHWAWMTQVYCEFASMLEKCDRDAAMKAAVAVDGDVGGNLSDSLYREGYYYAYAVRLAVRRQIAYRSSLSKASVTLDTGDQQYEISRDPLWIGDLPIVVPSSSDSTAPTSNGGSATRRRRRGATADMTRSPDVDDPLSLAMPDESSKSDTTEMSTARGTAEQNAVSNPFDCLESNVDHASNVMEMILRARDAQSLFAPRKTDARDELAAAVALRSPSSKDVSCQAVDVDELPGKVLNLEKDKNGHLGIKFDDKLVVLASSPWARKRGVVPGQVLLACDGNRLWSTSDVMRSIEGKSAFKMKVLPKNEKHRMIGVKRSEASYPRRRAALDVVEAEQYLRTGAYKACLATVMLCVRFARTEGWSVLLFKSLDIALRAASSIVSAQDGSQRLFDAEASRRFALELMSPALSIPLQRRTEIADILVRSIMECDAPGTADIHHQYDFDVQAISVRPSFRPATATAGDTVTCLLYFTSGFPVDVSLTKASIAFTIAAYDSVWSLDDTSTPLILSPGDDGAKVVPVQLKVSPLDGKAAELRVRYVDLMLSIDAGRFGKERDSAFLPVRITVPDRSECLDLLPPDSSLVMRWQHAPPALRNAAHPMTLTLKLRSPGDSENADGASATRSAIASVGGTSVVARFELDHAGSSALSMRVHGVPLSSKAPADSSALGIVKLPDLLWDTEQRIRLSVLGTGVQTSTTVTATVEYRDANLCLVRKLRRVSVPFSDPLRVDFEFQELGEMSSASKLCFEIEKPLLLHVRIRASDHELAVALLRVGFRASNDGTGSVASVVPIPSPGQATMEDKTSQCCSNILGPLDVFSTAFHVTPRRVVDNVSLGDVYVKWRLLNAPDDAADTTTYVPLPKISIRRSGVSIDLSSPPEGVRGVPFHFVLRINNDTSDDLPLSLAVERSGEDTQTPTFLFAGDTSCVLLAPSNGVATHRLILVPLKDGFHVLPKISLSAKGSNGEECALPNTSQRRIFIRPGGGLK